MALLMFQSAHAKIEDVLKHRRYDTETFQKGDFINLQYSFLAGRNTFRITAKQRVFRSLIQNQLNLDTLDGEQYIQREFGQSFTPVQIGFLGFDNDARASLSLRTPKGKVINLSGVYEKMGSNLIVRLENKKRYRNMYMEINASARIDQPNCYQGYSMNMSFGKRWMTYWEGCLNGGPIGPAPTPGN